MEDRIANREDLVLAGNYGSVRNFTTFSVTDVIIKINLNTHQF